ncbi:hypothetical protein CHUAL_009558 [Chamberlinius hualienensis]
MSLQHGRSFGFNWSGIKKFPSLAPMVIIMGVAVTGCMSYCIYALNKKDVIIQRSNPLPPWERTDLQNPKPSKIITINQKYDADERLKELKKEIH